MFEKTLFPGKNQGKVSVGRKSKSNQGSRNAVDVSGQLKSESNPQRVGHNAGQKHQQSKTDEKARSPVFVVAQVDMKSQK